MSHIKDVCNILDKAKEDLTTDLWRLFLLDVVSEASLRHNTILADEAVADLVKYVPNIYAEMDSIESAYPKILKAYPYTLRFADNFMEGVYIHHEMPHRPIPMKFRHWGANPNNLKLHSVNNEFDYELPAAIIKALTDFGIVVEIEEVK